ncbi:MutS-related protein [Flavobacterium sp. HNIBRBA15423]|uniref:MutS-related protein n=1 Tax=Flavobacterium sp. HNIBRBA15423 TaxID=3458683 RepID=UPI00404440AF
MSLYLSLKKAKQAEIKKIKKEINLLSFLRFLSILIVLYSGYSLYKEYSQLYLFIGLISLVAFFFLLRYYDKKNNLKKHKEAIVAINDNELAFLNNEKNIFENGLEFTDVHHEYGYDLDIFGENSLFQNLNRTHTYIGKKTLANALLNQVPNDAIIDNQEAIKELASKIEWRQDFMANAKISKDTEKYYKQLIEWSNYNSKPFSRLAVVLSYVLPIVFILLAFAYYFSDSNNLFSYLVASFLLNLGFASRFFKRIKLENEYSTAIDKIVKQYGLMIANIEQEAFKSKKLIALQNNLKTKSIRASVSLHKLSRLFSVLDSVANPLVAIFLNGFFLYHIISLRAIIQWKTNHAKDLENWLAVIGEFEVLQSLANFSYNNPDFTFPILNENHEISFTKMSHPLLNAKSRVTNTIDFQPKSFIILTGSNMSGKSTFLRSLGVNMVLARIGSVVCASQANVHPMPILVSMRLSDSLSDSESYFYAEIKRLKQIMNALEEKRSFVLLDEILRGTNSDDKRSGTVEVIKKMIGQKAIGAIATHDIEVCLTADEFPNKLINKCFEVEINNNDLHFDYTLRDGICKNKSATFLMKKIGVI